MKDGAVNAFLKQVETNIQERHLFAPREKILVAVSGGVDSMVLLHALHQLSQSHHWRLTVAHLNHELRGRSSDGDQRFVRETARNFKLSFVTEKADVKAFSQSHKISIEMAARGLRHEFFARVARTKDIVKIATAHQADDQIELFLLRLLRGAGVEGLSGMRWKGPSPSDPQIELVRPLLNCSRSEIVAFAREQKIRFREDVSNQALDYQRNRIRHELRPLLEGKYQPALSKVLSRLMNILGAENDFVLAQARRWLGARQPDFESLPLALQRRVLELQCRQHQLQPSYELIEQLRLAENLPVSLDPQRAVIRDKTGLVHIEKASETAFNPEEKWVDLSGNSGIVLFGDIKLSWQRLNTDSFPPVKRSEPGTEIFDAEKLGIGIWLRHWRPGDRFQPLGMTGKTKLQDLFVNHKIPRSRRHQLVIASRTDGEVFWIEGLRIGECCKWEKKTKALLQWRWEPLI